MTAFISSYGVWLVAAFIALESVGLPLPGEAALMAAAVFAAATHDLDIRHLIPAAILAAILGNIAGFWVGRRFGHELLTRYGPRVGLTESRIRIGQWLFMRYGGMFVFTARFLPFLRNMAALLAGTNGMTQNRFYIASTSAAIVWVMFYTLGAYSLGEAFTKAAAPAAIILGFVTILIIVSVPLLVMRYEKQLLARVDHELPAKEDGNGRRS